MYALCVFTPAGVTGACAGAAAGVSVLDAISMRASSGLTLVVAE